ncbi:MAG: hypothetical protein A2161_02205 [Candidatus Schekmanbacteria bacterium RBG_13_48_7]|uniref:Uridine phosphorylase n=1 Tax=Candidatus Schekmanbacteria bacterium RBG_13_48_7 TaxID=1817878 RepID=A0A1F7RTA4_9BACT|nr:MAG: hypothetical protein A2161_02205 [Candidatus Schekmanbacteria bacterium RBG_13_48_7]
MCQIYLNNTESKERIAKAILKTTQVESVVILPVSGRITKEFLKAFKNYKNGGTYSLKINNRWVSLSQSTIGAPALEIQVNALFTAGARTLIRADFCGSLSPEIHVGDLFIAQDAIPADGVSGQYSPSDIVKADGNLLDEIKSIIENNQYTETACNCFFNRIITVDYFFAQKIETMRDWSHRASCVDMETAALYAISEKLDLHSISVMTVSDEKLSDIDLFISKEFPFMRLFSGVRKLVSTVISLVENLK